MYVAPESNVLFGLAAVAETSAPVVTTTQKPDVTTKPTTTATTPVTEKPTENNPSGGTAVTLYGDANVDGVVTMADAAAIYQALGNADKYGLSEQGAANADVNGAAGLTADDAITIQKVVANLIVITDLPLKSNK